MSLAAALLVVGGAVSFLMGAVTGFWVHAGMKLRPGEPPEKYRMVAHKEALWSSFLCFAIAGWIDQAPLSEPVALVIAATVVLTGWFAQGQYVVIGSAQDPDSPPTLDVPLAARAFGAGALLVNLIAVAGLLWAAALVLQGAL